MIPTLTTARREPGYTRGVYRALPARIIEAVGEYRQALVMRFGTRLLEMRIFGSQARGDATPESDVDVLVLIEGLTERERRVAFDLAYDANTSTRVPLAPFVQSRAELDELRERELLIAREIERDSVPV